MTWEKEKDFRDLLQRVAKKATKESLDALAALAVEEDKKGYKHVCALLMKELKEIKPQYRLKVFYGLSSIVRLSVEKRGSRDKYVGRLAPLLDEIAKQLVEAPPDHQKQMLKVLNLWWNESVFSAPAIEKLRQQLGAGAAGASGSGGQAQETGFSGAAAPAGAPAPAPTQESSGPVLSLPGAQLSPMSLPESGAASADGGDKSAGEGGATASQAAAKRPKVGWGSARGARQANSALTAGGSSGVAQGAAGAPGGGAAGGLHHSDSTAALAALPPLPPPPPPPPLEQQQQAPAFQEYDPLAAADDPLAGAGAALPQLPPGLPPPPPPTSLPRPPAIPPPPPPPLQQQPPQPPWLQGNPPPGPPAAELHIAPQLAGATAAVPEPPGSADWGRQLQREGEQQARGAPPLAPPPPPPPPEMGGTAGGASGGAEQGSTPKAAVAQEGEGRKRKTRWE